MCKISYTKPHLQHKKTIEYTMKYKKVNLNYNSVFSYSRVESISVKQNCQVLNAGVGSLIFLPKTLIWNKSLFQASNSLNLAELVVNNLMKCSSKKNYQYSFFYSDLSLLNVKISRTTSTSPKCYWTLLKTLLNGRKIPCIPPLLHDSKFITVFKEMSEIFNSFFAKQCLLIDNGSTSSSLFPLIIEKSLSDVDFSVEDIKNINSKLD